MVRRVGFGGDEKPNEQDAKLRRKYHRTDGNHSDRAHKVREKSAPAPAAQPRQPRTPKPITISRIMTFAIVGFFVLPMVLSVLFWFFGSLAGGEINGFFGVFMLIVFFAAASKFHRFIKKALSLMAR